MNRIIRVAIVVVICAALAMLTWALMRQTFESDAVLSSAEQLRVESDAQRPPERYLANVAMPARGPVYELESGKSRLRLITFLHLDRAPEQETYDPERRYTYGLLLTVRDDARQVIHEERVWFETRKSLAFEDGGELRDSSALYLAPGERGQPADQRLFDVDLERWSGSGHTLEVRTLGEQGRPEDEHQVNIVAFWRVERSEERVAWKMRTLEQPERMIIGSRTGLSSWSRLSEEELEAALRYTHVRHTSLEETQVRQVLSTDYRRSTFTEPTEGLLVAPDAPVVYNLEGPVTLSVAARSEGAVAIKSEVMGFGTQDTWQINEVKSIGLKSFYVQDDTLGLSGLATTLVKLEEGQSATVAVWPEERATPMMFFVDRFEGVLGEHTTAQLRDGSIMVWPDRKKIRLFTLSEESVHYTLSRDEARLGEGVMMTFRVLDGIEPIQVTYGFPELGFERTLTLADEPDAPFERVERSDGTPARTSEPHTFKLWLPPGASTLSLRADRPGQVAASVSLMELRDGVELMYRPPYSEQLRDELQTWRYGPLAQAPWLTIAPHEARDLKVEGRQVLLLAQVRRVWSQRASSEMTFEHPVAGGPVQGSVLNSHTDHDEDSRARRHFVAIEPARAWREELIWDRMPGAWLRTASDIERFRERWTQYDAIGFPPHHPWSCELPGVMRPGQRLEVQYSVPEPGGPMTLSYAGEPRRRQLVRTRSTTEVLWTQGWPERGELLLDIRGPEGDLVDELARANCFPTRPDARLSHWRSRRVHGLTARHDLVLSVDAEEETWNLNMVVYMDVSTAEIEVTIDGGEPVRSMLTVPEFTRASRTLSLEARRDRRVPFVRAANRSVYGPVKVSMPIGADLAKGTHEVRVRWRGDREARAWLRFFRMREP